MTEIIGVRTPLTAVGNKGQIPIARRSFAGREPCFTHLGSDPYWRGGVNGDPRPGCAPGRAVPFLCLAKEKEPKERPPPLPAPYAIAAGTCGARFGRGLAKLAALKQTPALIRPKLRSSALAEGDPGYGIGGAKRRIAPRARNWVGAPAVCRSDSIPLTTTPSSRPARCPAQPGRSRMWGPPLYAPRSAAPRGSAGRMFERSEFAACPRGASTAGSRSASGGRRQWGWPFFWFLFFGQAKKRDCAAGRTSRPTMHRDELTP